MSKYFNNYITVEHTYLLFFVSRCFQRTRMWNVYSIYIYTILYTLIEYSLDSQPAGGEWIICVG